ncbi:MAG: hypothetical protein RIG62_02880 [Cyclobacteriaceae bacterium]
MGAIHAGGCSGNQRGGNGRYSTAQVQDENDDYQHVTQYDIHTNPGFITWQEKGCLEVYVDNQGTEA